MTMNNRDLSSSTYVLLLIIIISLLIFQYAPGCGMKYDSGKYAGLAYHVTELGEYNYNGMRGDLPPAFPLFLAFALKFGDGAIDYVTPLFAVLLGAVAFLFFSIHGKKRFAFLAALLITTNPAVFEYSIGHYRDIPILFFVFTFYLLYERAILDIKENEKSEPDKIMAAGIGIFFALAFLSTYSAFLYFLPILIHSARMKNTFIFTSLGASVLIILPWSIWSTSNFGTPLVEHSSYLKNYIDVSSALQYFSDTTFPAFFRFSKSLVILGVLGFIKEISSKETRPSIAGNMYLQLAVLTILPNAIWPEQAVRYLFPALISLGYFAMPLLSRMKYETLLTILLLLMVTAQIGTATDIADYNCPRFLAVEDAGIWLRENSDPGDTLMAGSFSQTSYFSRRVTLQIPSEQAIADLIIKEKDVKYVVVDTYEKTTPDYAYTYFEKYALAEEFSHLGEVVKIYKVN